MNKKTAILLINLGTPDSLTKKSIKKFLSEFLNDARVINLPFLLRKILVNLIIVPFRTSKSKKLYEKLWTKEGSPIITKSKALVKKLNHKLDENHNAFIAMRYRNPSIKSVLNQIKSENFSKIIIIPLFPQYASSTTGSVIEKTISLIKNQNNFTDIEIISSFYDNTFFIDAWIKKIKEQDLDNFEHILFSYHGLPIKHVEQTHKNKSCQNYNCKNEINENNQFCYLAQCYETTRLIANKLNLDKEKFTTCFQSRFSKNWLSPFADEIIIEKAKEGIKNILVVSPSFTADCLETIVEIGIDYKELFLKNGGKNLQLVESLNDDDLFVKTILDLIKV
ncbi:MAG: ferrochelatase [Bacteroidales bacterium]|nr:ferrochelatase [Bacteroidales bacterium]MBN2756229.1 ferrochelatase [Bacteroidales bacterium]